MTLAELHAELTGDMLSPQLDGTNPTMARQEHWVDFRHTLERLLSACTTIAEQYRCLYDDITPTRECEQLWTLSSEELSDILER